MGEHGESHPIRAPHEHDLHVGSEWVMFGKCVEVRVFSYRVFACEAVSVEDGLKPSSMDVSATGSSSDSDTANGEIRSGIEWTVVVVWETLLLAGEDGCGCRSPGS